MINEISEQSTQNVKHQENVSTLQKRRPSKVEDEKFHSQLDSSYKAAKLRSLKVKNSWGLLKGDDGVGFNVVFLLSIFHSHTFQR